MNAIAFGDRRDANDYLPAIARALVVLIPVVGVAGVVVPYAFGLYSLAILATYIAVPALLVPVLYRYTSAVETDAVVQNPRVDKLLVSGYFLLQAVSVVLLATNEVRPYSYYAVIAALGVIVLARILRFSPEAESSWPILGQQVLLYLNLAWGVTLKYNYFIGRTDIFGHVYILRQILQTNALYTSESGFYQSFQLWHVFGAMENVLFGGQIAPRTTLFVLSGLLYALLPVGVYLVAIRLFDSPKVALTAGLLTCLDGSIQLNGMYSIPRSTAAFLFVFMLLAWVRDGRRSVFLFGLFSVAIAAYHTVTLPFLFVILSIDYFFRRFLVPALSGGAVPRRVEATYFLLALIVVVQAAYWLFFADSLLQHVVSLVFRQSAPGQVNPGVLEEPLRELANYVHNSALLVFIFLGTLTGLSSDRVPGNTKATLLTGLVLVGLSFPGPHLLLERLAGSFNVHRFSQYAFPFLAMAAAYGVVASFRSVTAPPVARETIKVVALVVFVVFSMMTVSNDFVASDNPAVERQFYTNYISEAEEESLRTTAAIGAGNVSSDYVGARYYAASEYGDDTRVLGVSESTGSLHLGAEDDLLVIREAESQRRPLQVWATDDYPRGGYFGELRYVDREARLWSDLTVTNEVYDSGAVSGYQRSNAVTDGPSSDARRRPATVDASAEVP